MYTLLVPVDYSNTCLKALEVAVYLAARIKARVLLCHIYHPPVLVDEEAAEDDPEAFIMTEADSEQEALKKLQTFAALVAENTQHEVQVTIAVKTGSIVEELQKLVKEHHVTLIVMGTGKPNTLLNRVLGSTTEKLLKEAPCPVLAVPEKAQANPFGRIVYATALEPYELNALIELSQARKLFNATIAVLYVEAGDHLDLNELNARKSYLLKHFSENELMFSQVVSKEVADGIEQFVMKFNADLVAFTVSPHTFWEKLTHRSVISCLIHDLELPLLAFPPNTERADLDEPEESREVAG